MPSPVLDTHNYQGTRFPVLGSACACRSVANNLCMRTGGGRPCQTVSRLICIRYFYPHRAGDARAWSEGPTKRCEMIHREPYDAIRAKDPELLREIVACTDVVNGQDFGYPPPLSAAAGRWGCADTVRVPLDSGTDVNGQGSPVFQGHTPWEQSALVSAATYGHADTFEVHLGASADPLIGLGRGQTLIDWLAHAKHEGHAEMAEMIRTCQPDIFLDFWTASSTPGVSR